MLSSYKISPRRILYRSNAVNLPKDLCDKIVSVFPKEETLAIIVFGSYGTQRQRIDSDIDIAWIPNHFTTTNSLASASVMLSFGIPKKGLLENSGGINLCASDFTNL